MKFDPKDISQKRIWGKNIFFRILNGETAYFVFAGGKGKPKTDEEWSNYWPNTGLKWPEGTCFFDKAELDEWIEGMVAHLKKEGNVEALTKEESLYFQIVTLKMTVDSTIELGAPQKD